MKILTFVNKLKIKIMKKFFTSVLLFMAFVTFANAQLLLLSESTKFSLLTCGPGPLAYEKFGHSAVRIFDESQGVDVIANWGIFNFDDPGFYFKFVKGNTYYVLGISETSHFLETYRMKNASVTEQVLNLTDSERQRLLDAILINYRPENRKYLYNFVFDNCATRPHDIVGRIVQPKTLELADKIENKTFREWIRGYTGKNSWLQFGIDLLFGKDADEVATPLQAMFLPEVLYSAYDGAKIIDETGVETPLISEENILLEKRDERQKKSPISLPLLTTSLLLVIGVLITYFENKKKKHYKAIDVVLFLLTGIVGLVIFYLAVFSIHPLVKSNYNLLWCNPLNLLAVVFIFVKKADTVLKRYLEGYFILLAFSFVIAVLKIQVLNIAFLPIIALLLVRVLYQLSVRREIQAK